jgi:hypothetical protein
MIAVEGTIRKTVDASDLLPDVPIYGVAPIRLRRSPREHPRLLATMDVGCPKPLRSDRVIVVL